MSHGRGHESELTTHATAHALPESVLLFLPLGRLASGLSMGLSCH
eukprot:COSAG06_NODE_67607_length_251_cov_1.013158_1_plen_44_part_10